MSARQLIPHMTPDSYLATCSAADSDTRVLVHVLIDRKNSSVHMHWFDETDGKTKAPIQQRQAGIVLPAVKDTDLVRQVVSDHAPVRGVKVERVSRLKGKPKSMPEGHPLRIIVRFNK